MKNYLKILLITAAIQLGYFGIGVLFIKIIPRTSPISDIGLWIFLAGFPIALIVDLILAILWGKNWKQKLIYIFLMPTNYVGPILVAGFFLYISWAFKQIFGI